MAIVEMTVVILVEMTTIIVENLNVNNMIFFSAILLFVGVFVVFILSFIPAIIYGIIKDDFSRVVDIWIGLAVGLIILILMITL